MPQPLVSVIVPVYQAEAYLVRCLDSLRAQTLSNFEVLCIDDGSPDRSGEMLDRYAALDVRFRVFHKQNEGVSLTRQYGLERARGRYVIHCDPDDYVEPQMLSSLTQKAEEENADMVICDYYSDTSDWSAYRRQCPTQLTAGGVLVDLLRSRLHGSTWNKLVRREVFARYGVRFPDDLTYWEDIYINCLLLRHPLRVAYLPEAFYHYVQGENVNSICASSTAFDFDYRVLLLHKFQDALRDTPYLEEATAALSYYLILTTFKANSTPPPHISKNFTSTVAMRATMPAGFTLWSTTWPASAIGVRPSGLRKWAGQP